MAEEPSRPHSWAAILGGIAAVITAIGTLLGVLAANHLFPWQPEPTEKSAPTTPPTTPPPTSTSPTTPTPPYIPGSDALGFSPPARCDTGHLAVAMGVTTQSELVVCQAGPGSFYYRAVRFSDRAPADYDNAVRSGVGFDVKNPFDDTRYEIRPDKLTIRMADGRIEASYPMTAYWPR